MNVTRTNKAEAPDGAAPDPKALKAIGRALEAHYADLVQARLMVAGDQESHLDLEDFRKALTRLPVEQREVLTLIGASGLSCEKAAAICEVGDRHDQEPPEPRPLEDG